jgi:1L-myo-inositol 1-phosphate cytidylyltransferase
VRRVVVTTGHEAAAVEAVLPALADRAGVAVTAQRVDDWSKPNGFSVMAGAARIDGDYLLMMADHIFSAAILQRLAGQGANDRGVTLAIDRRVDSALIDPHDATWVSTDSSGRIRAIGKTIAEYDAVDCGAFLATPELAGAIAEAVAAGRPGSLSDGMQRLADRGRAATMDIGEAWWLDVDDPRAHALAEAEAPRQLGEIYAGSMLPVARS